MIYFVFDSPELSWRPGGWFESLKEAQDYAAENDMDIYSYNRVGSRPLVGDGSGFRPHWNHGLGKWIETSRQYKSELKKGGFEEVGNEKCDFKNTVKRKEFISEEFISHAKELGAEITDGQIAEVKDTIKDYDT